MTKDEQLTMKRMKELSFQTSKRGYHTFTDFLNLNELSLFYSNLKEIAPVNYFLWGGYEEAERKMICFYEDDCITKEEFDITLIELKPIHAKFADQLTHRDFLGALMNLGIERSKLGDIFIKDNIGYVFTNTVIGEFIMKNLTKIKHTNIICSYSTLTEVDITPSFKEIKGTISSNRLDTIISLAFQSSRNSITGLIAGGKVYVNSKLVESNSYILNENDVVSVRGYGKFIFKGITNQTKKGRLCATILKYI